MDCGSGQLVGSRSPACNPSERAGRDVVAEVGRGWSGEGSGAEMLRAPQVIFPSADSPVPRLTCARGRGAAGRVQPAVPLGPGVPGPAGPALSTSCAAGERAEPGPGGLRRRLRGRRAGHSLGTCCSAAASPGRARCVTALPRSACVHVTRLVVRAGVRPRILSTLPPAPMPDSLLRLSPSSAASSRKPSEKSRACGNLFVDRRPHPLHSLQLAASEQPWPGSSKTPFVV